MELKLEVVPLLHEPIDRFRFWPVNSVVLITVTQCALDVRRPRAAPFPDVLLTLMDVILSPDRPY